LNLVPCWIYGFIERERDREKERERGGRKGQRKRVVFRGQGTVSISSTGLTPLFPQASVSASGKENEKWNKKTENAERSKEKEKKTSPWP
jgi:hypothetical protein